MGDTPRTSSLVATAAGIFVIVASSLLLTGSTSSSGGDDDRPPIIVSSGSIYFSNGDPTDVFKHWEKWRKDDDPQSNRWFSAQKGGSSIDSYIVVIEGVTATPAACVGIMQGVELTVDFTPSGGHAIQFRLGRHSTYRFPFSFKHEPVIAPPSGVNLTLEPPLPSEPAKLSYGGTGAVNAMTIDTLHCSIPTTAADQAALRIHIKPSPAEKK